MPVRAVLWDADGVLQDLPAGDPLFPALGAERSARFAEAVFAPLPALLRGELDMAAHLDALIEEYQLQQHREEILELWDRDAPVDSGRAALADIRASGMRCVLTTNQDTLRADHMRNRYAGRLDAMYFSCDVGAAKPEPAYFAHIAASEGLPVEQLLLVDDSAANVGGARDAGLAAECWHHRDGVTVLWDLLRVHGVAS